MYSTDRDASFRLQPPRLRTVSPSYARIESKLASCSRLLLRQKRRYFGTLARVVLCSDTSPFRARAEFLRESAYSRAYRCPSPRASRRNAGASPRIFWASLYLPSRYTAASPKHLRTLAKMTVKHPAAFTPKSWRMPRPPFRGCQAPSSQANPDATIRAC